MTTAYVDLPCGCRITLAFVCHTCPQHAYALAEAEQKIRQQHERFMEAMRPVPPQSSEAR
jgi:hypothetical protein